MLCSMRFDIKGKKYIGTPQKYYFGHVASVEARHTASDGCRRRSSVEVDFIACKGRDRYYIRSAYAMPDAEERDAETRPLAMLGIYDV